MASFVRRMLCTLTIFWSAILLILVQPVVAKAILPWFGGSAGVWVTSMLFFQVVLLGGYLYAHLINRIASVRVQVGIHLVLIAAALAFLPLGLNPSAKPAAGSSPEAGILLLLASVVGVPYFVLSTTSPLVQAWYSSSSNQRLPWRLYAVSNLGSLLALMAYPLGFEKWFSVREQMGWWTLGFWVFAALAVASAIVTARRTGQEAEEGVEWPGLPTVGTWLLLAAIPSVMWLAMATQISQDIGAIPFIWTVPLAVYLFSFVLTFESDRWYHPGLIRWLLPPFIGLAIYSMLAVHGIGVAWLMTVYLLTLLMTSVMCHGELARRKPGPAFVTYFYLIVSAGGALGGIFVGVIAPNAFNDYVELPFALVLTLLLIAVMLFRAPVRIVVPVFAICAAAIIGARLYYDETRVRLRNFYGVMRTVDQKEGDASNRILYNGVIIHGQQVLRPEARRTATTYYGENSAMAGVLRLQQNRGPVRVGVVGLGTGTLATYARPGDTIRFYEINPDLIGLARKEFTFLSDCLGTCEVALGDARLVLEQEQPQNFDLLILDAFSGDSVPVHLLTKEAVGIYLKHLKPTGVMAFHVSSRHLRLEPKIAGIVEAWGLKAYGGTSPGDAALHVAIAQWVIVSRDKEMELIIQQNTVLEPPSGSTWTDDYNDLLSALR